MGKIVAAMAAMHAPQLFTRPPEEDPKQLDAGVAAMRRLGEMLDETRTDALIVFASDHLETFFLKVVPTFAVIAGERAKTIFAGRTWAPAIHQSLVEDILENLVRRDFDMAYSQDAELGQSFAAPFEWVLGKRDPRGSHLRQHVSASASERQALRGAWESDCGNHRGQARARGAFGKRRYVPLSRHFALLQAKLRLRPLAHRGA